MLRKESKKKRERVLSVTLNEPYDRMYHRLMIMLFRRNFQVSMECSGARLKWIGKDNQQKKNNDGKDAKCVRDPLTCLKGIVSFNNKVDFFPFSKAQ